MSQLSLRNGNDIPAHLASLVELRLEFGILGAFTRENRSFWELEPCQLRLELGNLNLL